jgi:hypothetical protein
MEAIGEKFAQAGLNTTKNRLAIAKAKNPIRIIVRFVIGYFFICEGK